MENGIKIKESVRERYGQIVSNNNSSCCNPGSCCTSSKNIMNEDYNGLNGYNPDADYGLGCGLPTKFAQIKKGDTVIDLGSGAGNDCFVARAETGETGKVIGVDFTPEMIEKAKQNVQRRGFTNVEFVQGDIENIPLGSNLADVIVSNCVLNLVPNKQTVFNEIFRLLKPNGHFSISDIVLTGELPEKIRSAVEMHSACISGAVDKDVYLKNIQDAGFKNITIQQEKTIEVPEEELKNYLSEEEIKSFQKNQSIIKSITVYAEK